MLSRHDPRAGRLGVSRLRGRPLRLGGPGAVHRLRAGQVAVAHAATSFILSFLPVNTANPSNAELMSIASTGHSRLRAMAPATCASLGESPEPHKVSCSSNESLLLTGRTSCFAGKLSVNYVSSKFGSFQFFFVSLTFICVLMPLFWFGNGQDSPLWHDDQLFVPFAGPAGEFVQVAGQTACVACLEGTFGSATTHRHTRCTMKLIDCFVRREARYLFLVPIATLPLPSARSTVEGLSTCNECPAVGVTTQPTGLNLG